MKQKSSRRTVLAAAMAVAGVFGLVTSPAFADVHVSQNGATLTVTAPSTLAGKGLVLQTDAESSGTWTTKANIVGAVPAAGGSYTVDLAALGIANGTPCRIASATCYERLDKLLMVDRGKYIDTGIQGKNVYGVKMGFYPTIRGTAGTDDANFALNCGKAGTTSWTAGLGGFHIGISQITKDDNNDTKVRLEGPVLWGHHGYAAPSAERPYWSTNVLNDIAFTNRVFTLNGVTIKTDLHAGAISTNELTVTMGRNNPSGNYYSLCGYWGWLRLDDENGDAIIDYVPVRRASDNKVGFWDSVSNSLVVPTKEGQDLSVGEGVATGEIICDDSTLEVVADGIVPNRQLAYSSEAGAVTISIPAGLAGESIIIAWDSEDKGDDLADWAHSATLTDSATAGTITQNLSRLGIRNGTYVRVFAANVYKPLDMLQMTSKQMYVNTGIKDIDVYGIRFGYYATSTTAGFGGAIGTGEGPAWDGGFIVGSNNLRIDSWYWAYQGKKYSGTDRPDVSSNCINEVAFTNQMFTVSSVDPDVEDFKKTGLPAGAVAKVTENYSGANMQIGRSAKSTDFMYGWWSHVSFDDKDGNKILDYVPVQRVADGKVGFYDRATLTFVTSSGTGDFTAGTVTNDTPVVAVNASSAAWEVTDIQGLIIIFK